MVSGIRQILGLVMAVTGFLGSIIACVFPNWITITHIGGIVTPSIIRKGLWMECVIQATSEHYQCRVSDSLSALSQDQQAARGLVIIAIIFGVFGILLVTVGGRCTNSIQNERQKCKADMAAGVIFIITGLLVLIPVCWTANTIIRYPTIPGISQFKDLGVSLYIGWSAAGLLFLGGGLICSCKKKRNLNESVRFSSLTSEEV